MPDPRPGPPRRRGARALRPRAPARIPREVAARATHRGRRGVARAHRPRGAPPGGAAGPRGSSGERDREHRPGASGAQGQRPRPIPLVTTCPASIPLSSASCSVASVSLAPPLVLVSVDQKNDLHPALRAAQRFVLNVLASDQEAVSRRFAEEHPNRFDGIGYRETKHGIPVLEGVLASIECEKQAEAPGGDHTVFFALVTGGTVSDRRPLLYYRGGYAGLGGGGA